MRQMLASCSASMSELKENPTALLSQSEGAPIAILNHNIPTAYLISAGTFEWLMDKLDDSELAQLVKDRECEKKNAIDVTINDL